MSKINEAIFFEDGEYAEISANNYRFFKSSKEVKKSFTKFEWTRKEETKKEYKHFMIKEVYEQPVTSKRLIDSLATAQKEKLLQILNSIKKK